jgi:hypothetical protein
MVDDLGRDPTGFANGLSTMWFHIDDRLADEVLEQRLVPVMKRPAEQLRERLAFGPADVLVSRLAAFRDAGVQQVFGWPVLDEIDQLHRFSAEVLRQLGARSPSRPVVVTAPDREARQFPSLRAALTLSQ